VKLLSISGNVKIGFPRIISISQVQSKALE